MDMQLECIRAKIILKSPIRKFIIILFQVDINIDRYILRLRLLLNVKKSLITLGIVV